MGVQRCRGVDKLDVRQCAEVVKEDLIEGAAVDWELVVGPVAVAAGFHIVGLPLREP